MARELIERRKERKQREAQAPRAVEASPAPQPEPEPQPLIAAPALEALLWVFHNAKRGFCFPSYEAIAEAAGCARSTVAEAIRALEDAGILSWVQRIKRVRERCSDLLGDNGWRWRVIRSSNAYNFRDPGSPDSSKSEKPTGTPIQEFFFSMSARTSAQIDGPPLLKPPLPEFRSPKSPHTLQ